MTRNDELAIAHYMNWNYDKDDGIHYYNWEGKLPRNLDLNDAGLCVREMQMRGDDYVDFIKFAYDMAFDEGNMQFHTVIAWLYVRDNFFKAMAVWLKEGKK